MEDALNRSSSRYSLTSMSASVERPLLFAPLTLREITLPNRIMVSPMCQYSSIEGYATDWHLVHLGSRAVGGAGMVMLETAAVERSGRISHGDLGIWEDGHIEMLSRISRFLTEHGAMSAIQIGHAGRKSSQRRPWDGGGPLPGDEAPWQTEGPSAIPFDDEWHRPKAMDADDIKRVVDSFRVAAQRARDAGFIVLEVHAAHGYLLNQFLSSSSNQREDRYGGSFENRIRLTCEVVEAVRQEWPDERPLFVRISATDWAEHGWSITDSLALVRKLQRLGVDVIDVSSGGNVARVTIPNEAGYQVPFAEALRRETGVPVVAVGLITSAQHAEDILRSEQTDIVALGREFLREPYWPFAAAAALDVDIDLPRQYQRAKRQRS